jgi:hypothetical protein
VRRALIAVCVLAACAGSHQQPVKLEAAALPELQQARELAPDYAVRVDSAQQSAKLEPTEAGRQQQLRRAQLLSLAARAEAERVAILRELPAYEARIEVAQVARAKAERERIALTRARVLEAAGAAEQREAAWAFGVLAGAVSSADRDRLWEFLVRRTQALCAAARMLAAPANDLDEADLQLTAARTAKLPARVESARRALRVAQHALGRARAGHEPAAAERRDLRERLHERGLAASATHAGPAIALGKPASAQLMRNVAVLDDVLEAFPHGPIVVSCGQRAACSATWFSPGLRERVRIEEGPAQPGGEVVRVVLPAYAEGPAGP